MSSKQFYGYGETALLSCPMCSMRHLPTQGHLENGIYACTCQNCGHFFKFRAQGEVKSSASFKINGKQYTVGNETNVANSLHEFLKKNGISVGTKGCCYEGGCGVCLVTISLFDPVTQQKVDCSANSCCVPLFSCDGLEVTTIEGLGNTKTGLHPIQEKLAEKDGAQCGFCSPGQVMNMYGLLKKNPKPSVDEIEDAFDATLCRCTGYRSILDAMKTFAVDAEPHLKQVYDIEELDAKLCKRSGKPCTGHCSSSDTNRSCENKIPQPLHVVSGPQWLRPVSLQQLLGFLQQYKDQNYRLVFGNTGFGVYKEISLSKYDILIDLRGVQEFYKIEYAPQFAIGANVSINNLIDVFNANKTNPKMPYAGAVVKHLKRVAMNGIRNLGSWAGNLMMKHQHQEFQSDIFTLLETLGTKLSIVDSSGTSLVVNLLDFLNADMKGRVIAGMVLPTYNTQNVQVRTYKTALRLQACHGYVVSGFNFDLNANTNFMINGRPTIVFLGINAKFIHAIATETYLTNKQLADPNVLKEAFNTLSNELKPDQSPGQSSASYRKSLALSTFYKYVLDVCKTKVDPRYLSGGQGIDRPAMTGTQDYGTNKKEWPLNQPVHKTTEKYLTSGMVKFLDDLPETPKTLSAAVVVSDVGNCTIDKIDSTDAEAYPGVVAFITAKDVPQGGINNWRPLGISPDLSQELLSTGASEYAGQPIGIIVADCTRTAEIAASMVKITYKDQKPVVTDLKEAIQKKMFFANPPPPLAVGDAKTAIASAPHKVTGNISCGDQYQFHLENQTSICTPTDVGGMHVQASSQWIDGVLETVSQVLGLQQSDVTVEVERLGGGFGGKISQNFLVSGLCALAAHVVDRPVKLHLSLSTNMKMLGKRSPYYAEYQVGTDTNGKLQGILINMYGDVGMHLTSAESDLYAQDWFDNAYYCANWLWTPIPVQTHKAVQTACRAPGSVPNIFVMESIMEHVAKSLNLDELTVRKANLYAKGQKTPNGTVLNYCTIQSVVPQLESQIDLPTRKQSVDNFNKANRWKKRGIAVMPNRFGISFAGAMYNTSVMIYHGDGSVAIAHGGIDMGQGISTKTIQVCAYELGIPMDTIRVKKSSTTSNANSITTGGSVTAQLCCKSVLECCKLLNERLAPVKAKMVNPTWQQLITKCFEEMVDLKASYMTHPTQPYPDTYSCYSAACVEAEVDVLTGQYQIRQMDMLYDCGESISPELDIGQAEGGFIMGLGYFLQEEMKYDAQSGRVLNDGTWEYKPPMPKDLPVKFNFKFQRNAPNPLGVLRAKAVGEPPVAMAAAGVFAIKRAVEAARAETGQNTFFAMNAPATVEKVQQLCGNGISTYTLGK